MIEIKKLPTNRWKDYRELRIEALKSDPAAFSSSHVEEQKLSITEWKRRMNNVLFALDEDKPIGMMVYVFLKLKKIKHVTNIYGVYVKKEYRTQGIGKQLLENVLTKINQNKNIIKINLHVNPKQKAALQLYKKFGFKKIGTLKKDICVNGKFYDEIIMEKFI